MILSLKLVFSAQTNNFVAEELDEDSNTWGLARSLCMTTETYSSRIQSLMSRFDVTEICSSGQVRQCLNASKAQNQKFHHLKRIHKIKYRTALFYCFQIANIVTVAKRDCVAFSFVRECF